MEITVFKCYFPKCMIMCNCSPDWFFTIAETKYISTAVSYTYKLKVDKIGRLKLHDWTITDQRKCKGGLCWTRHCWTAVAGVDIAGLGNGLVCENMLSFYTVVFSLKLCRKNVME